MLCRASAFHGLSLSGLQVGLYPEPAMLIKKSNTGTQEVLQVRHALARCVTAVVHNMDRRIEYQAPLATQPEGQVEIFEIQEIALVETTGCANGVAAHQHKTSAGQHDFSFPAAGTDVEHFIATKPPLEHATNKTRG